MSTDDSRYRYADLAAMPAVDGIRLSALSAGIKTTGDSDLVLIELPEKARVAGVFTQNAFCAAPVILCRRHLQATSHPGRRYLIINSGNANAGTGERGIADALTICEQIAAHADKGIGVEQVLPFSTGVIGEYLPVAKITAAIPHLFDGLSAHHWLAAAQGIMTTDTLPKGASYSFDYQSNGSSDSAGSDTFIVNGVAKGAGMIRPNMATMLAFVATNATIDQDLLEQLLTTAVDQSFNRISIDGDTSTNDSCLLMTTATTTAAITDRSDPRYRLLADAVTAVYRQLAQAIVKDAEGATKFVTIRITEGNSVDECLQVAYAIAHSPLVKTAFYAADPNWGRIVAAIGNAPIPDLDINKVRLFLDDILVVDNGARAATYREADGQKVMDKADFQLTVNLGRGVATEEIWTSDLSHDYVTINAEYRS